MSICFLKDITVREVWPILSHAPGSNPLNVIHCSVVISAKLPRLGICGHCIKLSALAVIGPRRSNSNLPLTCAKWNRQSIAKKYYFISNKEVEETKTSNFSVLLIYNPHPIPIAIPSLLPSCPNTKSVLRYCYASFTKRLQLLRLKFILLLLNEYFQNVKILENQNHEQKQNHETG